MLGYEIAPEGGRLLVKPAEAEQVLASFAVAAHCSTLTGAVRQVRAQGFTAKQWTSQAGKSHGGGLLLTSTLQLLLSNVLYRGDISHKGTIYPGEQEAIVSRELWQEVNTKLKLGRDQTPQRSRVETLLGGVLRCGRCDRLLKTSFTRRQGRRHLYYVCRAGKTGESGCSQRPVACADLDASLEQQLERLSGPGEARFELPQRVRAVSYHSASRQVTVELRDASRFDYRLPVPSRVGVANHQEKSVSAGSTPRISRLLALALKFERLVSEGVVRNYRELAELGHMSRPRLCQLMRLTQLAPSIQEKLLFLPATQQRPDRICERQLRFSSGVLDWEKQRELFRTWEAEWDQKAP